VAALASCSSVIWKKSVSVVTNTRPCFQCFAHSFALHRVFPVYRSELVLETLSENRYSYVSCREAKIWNQILHTSSRFALNFAQMRRKKLNAVIGLVICCICEKLLSISGRKRHWLVTLLKIRQREIWISKSEPELICSKRSWSLFATQSHY